VVLTGGLAYVDIQHGLMDTVALGPSRQVHVDTVALGPGRQVHVDTELGFRWNRTPRLRNPSPFCASPRPNPPHSDALGRTPPSAVARPDPLSAPPGRGADPPRSAAWWPLVTGAFGLACPAALPPGRPGAEPPPAAAGTPGR
jgi:hypothetical protein